MTKFNNKTKVFLFEINNENKRPLQRAVSRQCSQFPEVNIHQTHKLLGIGISFMKSIEKDTLKKTKF